MTSAAPPEHDSTPNQKALKDEIQQLKRKFELKNQNFSKKVLTQRQNMTSLIDILIDQAQVLANPKDN